MNRISMGFVCTISCFVTAMFSGTAATHAQNNPKRIALRSGDSVELRDYYFVAGCQSIMIGPPQLDVLEGPEEVTVTLTEGTVLPRAEHCGKPVLGGSVVATARDVTEPKQAKLTIRLKFNTKAGERQGRNTYIVSLLPGAASSGESSHTSLPATTLESTGPALSR